MSLNRHMAVPPETSSKGSWEDLKKWDQLPLRVFKDNWNCFWNSKYDLFKPLFIGHSRLCLTLNKGVCFTCQDILQNIISNTIHQSETNLWIHVQHSRGFHATTLHVKFKMHGLQTGLRGGEHATRGYALD